MTLAQRDSRRLAGGLLVVMQWFLGEGVVQGPGQASL